MVKTINIDGKDVSFKASGATPLRYRAYTGRDLIRDLQGLSAEDVDTQVLSELTYVMHRQAEPDDAMTIEDFLDQFSLFGLLGAFGQIMELWTNNTATTVKAKKK